MLLLFAVVAYIALVLLALLSDRIIFQPHPSSYRLSDLAASSRGHALFIHIALRIALRTCGRQVGLSTRRARRNVLKSHINWFMAIAKTYG